MALVLLRTIVDIVHTSLGVIHCDVTRSNSITSSSLARTSVPHSRLPTSSSPSSSARGVSRLYIRVWVAYVTHNGVEDGGAASDRRWSRKSSWGEGSLGFSSSLEHLEENANATPNILFREKRRKIELQQTT